MNSILRKVVPQGITATANSCREQISFIYLISVLWRACLLGFCSGCSTTMGQLHGTSGWSSYLAVLEELSSSFILSFGGLFSILLLVTFCFSQLSLLLCFKTIDIHLWVWGRGFGLCRRHCFSFVALQAVKHADHRALFCLCCDPSVGGRASREHRGANETLGMPAGGEEPGAATGESPRRCCARER